MHVIHPTIHGLRWRYNTYNNNNNNDDDDDKPKSEIEETIERIKMHKGVEQYVILDGDGEVLRSYPPNNDDAEDFGQRMRDLTGKAMHVVRDIDPDDKLDFARIRCVGKEVLVGVDNDFTVIIVQKWQPAPAV